MDTFTYNVAENSFLCSSETVSAAEIAALVSACKANNLSNIRVRIPADKLPLFELGGFCVDGVQFSENGTECFNVQLSTVFDGCKRLLFSEEAEAVYTRTVFNAENITGAKLYITALGYFEPYFNGALLTEDKLIPAKSDYEQRDLSNLSYPIFDTMSHRIYYYTYDLTPYLRRGENVMAAHIGNGWYGDAKNPAEHVPQWGEKFLIFKLELTDADGKTSVIRSAAGNTRWHRSHVLESSLYYGEYHDYRKYINGWNDVGLDEAKWHAPTEAALPHTYFMEPDFPADAVCGEIEPKLIERCGDRKLYDLGETASGYPIIVGDADATINSVATLRYADVLDENNALLFHYTGGNMRLQRDTYVFTPEFAKKELYPHFLWHASRYIELTGTAAIKTFVKVQTPLKRVSKFKSDDETLNWFFKAYTNTQEANIHGCIPSDCPHRERLGYTGDGQLACGAVMSIYDARDMYRKWMRDIRDCQDIRNGHVQHTAPFFGGGGGPGGWGGAAVIVPFRYYQFYNDVEILKTSYNSMKAYIGYMAAHCTNNIVTREEEKGWCLGDWCTPDKIQIPEPFVNSYFFVKCAEMCAKTAKILQKEDDAESFSAIADAVKNAIVREFYDPSTGSYCGGIQGADAFAMDIGLGNMRTLQNLVNKYEQLGTLDTGIFGTDILIRVLFREGYASLAYRLLTNKGEVSFYNMKKAGAMNIWEQWDGDHSRCHPMFGAVAEYFFSEILGIRRFEDRPGYKDVIIRPAEIPELRHVSGTMGTPWGNITVLIGTDSSGKRNVSYITDPQITVHTVS